MEKKIIGYGLGYKSSGKAYKFPVFAGQEKIKSVADSMVAFKNSNLNK